MATAARITKTQIKTIRECLSVGIPLELLGRKFTSGDITEDVRSNQLRTTHRTPDMLEFVWLPAHTVAALSEQAARKLTQKDAILAEMRRARDAFADAPAPPVASTDPNAVYAITPSGKPQSVVSHIDVYADPGILARCYQCQAEHRTPTMDLDALGAWMRQHLHQA